METIGWAVKQMHNGERVRRSGWNGKGMWLALANFATLESGSHTLPFVYMATVQGDLVPWLCSQTDLLAADWEIAA